MVFPRWTNKIPLVALVSFIALLTAIIGIFWYWGSPKHLWAGYQPVQPIAYSHKLHAGQMGMDCRYCHHIVEKSPHAGVPPTDVCMNCHSVVKTNSPEIMKLRDYHTAGKPVPWVRVHKVADYVYFNHSAHVNKGVSCVECHGRIDQMDVVRQVEPLSMAWCLECHTEPAGHVRDKKLVTNLAWKPEGDPAEYGKKFIEKYQINTRADCNTCHR